MSKLNIRFVLGIALIGGMGGFLFGNYWVVIGGAGVQTGMRVLAAHWLRQRILPGTDYKVKVTEPYQMLSEIDMEMIKKLQLDLIGIPCSRSIFGFPNEGWKPFTMNDGTEVLVPGQFNFTRDDEGTIYMYPDGDTSIPASAKMPKESYYFDAIPANYVTRHLGEMW